MENITITNCQFDNNKGFDGQVLYIEFEYISNTKLKITLVVVSVTLKTVKSNTQTKAKQQVPFISISPR